MTRTPRQTPPDPPASLPVTAADMAMARRHRAIRRAHVARALRLDGSSNRLRHGIYAVAAVREDVLDEAALLYARAPWLDPVRDGPLVEATARIAVRLRKLDAAVEVEPTATLTSMLSRLEGQLQRNLAELGLTPRAAAALGLAHADAAARARRLTDDTLARYRQGPAVE